MVAYFKMDEYNGGGESSPEWFVDKRMEEKLMRTQISCLPVSLYPEFFSGERTVPEYSRQAKELDLDAIDINALFLREKSMEEIQQIRSELTVPVLMVSAYSDFTLPSEEKRAEALETAIADMRRAQAVGAKYIRLTAGQAYPGEPDDQMVQRAYDCFAKCAEVSAETGVKILLENHSKPGAWEYPDYDFHVERFLNLWEALKTLPIAVNYDTANAYALKEWERLLEAVAGRIETVHLNDLSSIEPLGFARIGAGIVPMQEIVQAVYDTGFNGALCIEEAGFQGWDGIVKAAAYARELSEAIRK